MPETASDWANSAAEGVSNAFFSAKKRVWDDANFEEQKRNVTAGVSDAFYATKKRVWDDANFEETKRNAATGVSDAFYATKKRVWDDANFEERTKNASTAAAAGLNSALGGFRQLNQAGEPIFRHMYGGSLGMRQVNKFGRGAIWKATCFHGIFEGLGELAFYGAVAVDAYQVGEAVLQDCYEGTCANTVIRVASVAGSWIGGLAAGRIGAALLLSISPMPALGSLIGGIGGGVLGTVYGGRAGAAMARAFLVFCYSLWMNLTGSNVHRSPRYMTYY